MSMTKQRPKLGAEHWNISRSSYHKQDPSTRTHAPNFRTHFAAGRGIVVLGRRGAFNNEVIGGKSV